jgi:hypothetical protein
VLNDSVTTAFLPNYDLALAKLITAGVDLWLNPPQPPLEASGTSGMKAALNGIPSSCINQVVIRPFSANQMPLFRPRQNPNRIPVPGQWPFLNQSQRTSLWCLTLMRFQSSPPPACGYSSPFMKERLKWMIPDGFLTVLWARPAIDSWNL